MNEILFNRDVFPVVALCVILLFGVPMSYKENNSYWFAFIKTWFFIVPCMLFLAGIFIVFIGPAYAVVGLFNQEYIMVTILYIYIPTIWFIGRLINDKYNNILERL